MLKIPNLNFNYFGLHLDPITNVLKCDLHAVMMFVEAQNEVHC